VEAYLNLLKERYATMSDNSVIPLRQPETIDDPLTAVLRNGARRLLAQAIEACRFQCIAATCYDLIAARLPI
jgi:hypothetical protein